ncbi:Malate dehydrogenase-like 1 [Homarus americanus]|uniref:Malate dehydrogenase-like 1 n=1 Tax=Homarus americanus TaxID=6706 RepID=A0A8J5J9D7_HOMAM|nr:Malate dehydrogenase-like 1 [Homarus americanus]
MVFLEDEVERFVVDCMMVLGVPRSNATSLAQVLVAADVRGHYSHGLYRVDMYVNDLRKNLCDGGAAPTIVKESVSTAFVDGNNGLGPVVGNFCMDLAIKKAKATGIGWVCAKAAELVYGSTLCLPGEFIASTSTPSSQTGSYVETLRGCIRFLRLTSPRLSSQKQVFVDKVLDEATRVFVRRMAPGLPLQRPYDGPVRVLLRSSNFFTIDRQEVRHTVSIDRLKLAHIDEDADIPGPSINRPTSSASASDAEPVTTPPLPSCLRTRSGRSNHFGIAGWYTMTAAKQGLLGMSFTNTSSLVVPTRGKEGVMGTNPLSLAAPAKGDDSFVLDMATSVVALGKRLVQKLQY